MKAVYADIASGEVDWADVLFLVAFILFVVAAVLRVITHVVDGAIVAIGLACVALAFMLL